MATYFNTVHLLFQNLFSSDKLGTTEEIKEWEKVNSGPSQEAELNEKFFAKNTNVNNSHQAKVNAKSNFTSLSNTAKHIFKWKSVHISSAFAQCE